MNHEEFQRMIVLRSYGELSADESALLDEHLLSCAACRAEAAGFSKLFRVLEEHAPEVPGQDLVQAREALLDSLARNDRRSAQWGIRRRTGILSFFGPGRVFARVAAAIGLLGVGLFTGYLLFAPGLSESRTAGLFDPFQSKGLDISSVRFELPAPDSTDVVLSFNVAREVRLEGDLSDPKIQRILAYALVNEKNPGVRLRAVSAIGAETTPDSETVTALIAAMKTDANPAVRHQALTALRRYPLSTQIKRAFAEVLLQDKNARLRIEAIDALQNAAGRGVQFDQELVQRLGRKLGDDENSYVRRKAKSFLSDIGYSVN